MTSEDRQHRLRKSTEAYYESLELKCHLSLTVLRQIQLSVGAYYVSIEMGVDAVLSGTDGAPE